MKLRSTKYKIVDEKDTLLYYVLCDKYRNSGKKIMCEFYEKVNRDLPRHIKNSIYRKIK